MNRDPGVDKFQCTVCKVLCGRSCSNCLKVCYCSVEHQKEDWVNHKIECRRYPIKFKRTENAAGKMLVASTDIQPGQVILKETSLVSGPYALSKERQITLPGATVTCSPRDRTTDDDDIKAICLSCYKEITSPYSCSHCQWPVCSPQCEKKKVHADFECKLFGERNIKPGPLKDEITKEGKNIYDMITCVRALLLRHLDPPKWQKIMNNHSYSHIREMYPEKEAFKNITLEFIQQTCGMSGIDQKIIERVVDILANNCRGDDVVEDPQDTGTAKYLFHDLSFLPRESEENSNSRVEKTDISESEIEVQVIATRTIRTGEQIKTMDVEDQVTMIVSSDSDAPPRTVSNNRMRRLVQENPDFNRACHQVFTAILQGNFTGELAAEFCHRFNPQ